MKLHTSLVDLDNITPSRPRSDFSEEKIAELAESILEIGGVICPIILKRTGIETCRILDGDFQFWGAMEAAEKYPQHHHAMIRAFIVPDAQEDSYKKQKDILMNSENVHQEATPMTEEQLPDTTPVETSVEAPKVDVMAVIKKLIVAHKKNYLPIYKYRAKFPQMTREEQDQALYQLQREDKIQLSTLQDVRAYKPEQVASGIPQDIGGRLFFIIDENMTPAGIPETSPPPPKNAIYLNQDTKEDIMAKVQKIKGIGPKTAQKIWKAVTDAKHKILSDDQLTTHLGKRIANLLIPQVSYQLN